MKQSYAGKSPKVQSPSYIHETAVLIGEVQVADHVSLWPGAVLRGDEAAITLGAYSNVQDNGVLHTDHGQALVVGSHVTIGHGAILHACTVEDEALIGMGAVVLNGAVVGKGAVIAAGAVVSPGVQVAPGMLYVGVPAKPVRALSEAELAKNRADPEAYWGRAEILMKEREG